MERIVSSNMDRYLETEQSSYLVPGQGDRGVCAYVGKTRERRHPGGAREPSPLAECAHLGHPEASDKKNIYEDKQDPLRSGIGLRES